MDTAVYKVHGDRPKDSLGAFLARVLSSMILLLKVFNDAATCVLVHDNTAQGCLGAVGTRRGFLCGGGATDLMTEPNKLRGTQ